MPTPTGRATKSEIKAKGKQVKANRANRAAKNAAKGRRGLVQKALKFRGSKLRNTGRKATSQDIGRMSSRELKKFVIKSKVRRRKARLARGK